MVQGVKQGNLFAIFWFGIYFSFVPTLKSSGLMLGPYIILFIWGSFSKQYITKWCLLCSVTS